jgi:hypothetical protein
MLPGFILPETTVREAGTSAALDVAEFGGSVLLLTLGITRIIEQQSLDVSIWGSADGKEWGAKPLISFPQKFYCGTYQILLDLAQHTDVRYLRAKWSVARWGKGDPKPLFGIYLFVQTVKHQLLAAGAA